MRTRRLLASVALAALSLAGSPFAARAGVDAGPPDLGMPDVGPVDAGHEDAAIDTDAGGGCGNVTPQGSCTGTVLTYCDDATQEIVMVDCTDVSATSQCIEVSPTYGSDCAESAGEVCLDDNGEWTIWCAGQGGGCLDTEFDAVCAENLGPCTTDQVGTCNGDRLISECDEGQPYVIDCAAYTGHCANGACRDISSTHLCDDQMLLCAAGLVCNTTINTCIAAPEADAGTAPPPDSGSVPVDSGTGGVPPRADAGTTIAHNGDNDGDNSGCGCTSTTKPPAGEHSDEVAVTLLLAALALARRPRR